MRHRGAAGFEAGQHGQRNWVHVLLLGACWRRICLWTQGEQHAVAGNLADPMSLHQTDSFRLCFARLEPFCWDSMIILERRFNFRSKALRSFRCFGFLGLVLMSDIAWHSTDPESRKRRLHAEEWLKLSLQVELIGATQPLSPPDVFYQFVVLFGYIIYIDIYIYINSSSSQLSLFWSRFSSELKALPCEGSSSSSCLHVAIPEPLVLQALRGGTGKHVKNHGELRKMTIQWWRKTQGACGQFLQAVCNVCLALDLYHSASLST